MAQVMAQRLIGAWESEARQPLSNFVLLNENEQPLDIKQAVRVGYGQENQEAQLGMLFLHAQELYEDMPAAQKGSLTLDESVAIFLYTAEVCE